MGCTVNKSREDGEEKALSLRTQLRFLGLLELKQRYKECGLELHPNKTKIIYCKDDNRKGRHPETKFNFFGLHV